MKILIRSLKYLDIKQTKECNERNLQENYPLDVWTGIFSVSKQHSFVATHAKQVIAYILCDGNCIVSLAVDENYRHKGIARQLMYHCLNSISTDLKLHVRINNIHAITLYQSVNFSINHIISEYYVRPTEDAYLMIREPQTIKYPTKCKLNI